MPQPDLESSPDSRVAERTAVRAELPIRNCGFGHPARNCQSNDATDSPSSSVMRVRTTRHRIAVRSLREVLYSSGHSGSRMLIALITREASLWGRICEGVPFV